MSNRYNKEYEKYYVSIGPHGTDTLKKETEQKQNTDTDNKKQLQEDDNMNTKLAFVFDFDCTITSKHTYYYYDNYKKNIDKKYISNNLYDDIILLNQEIDEKKVRKEDIKNYVINEFIESTKNNNQRRYNEIKNFFSIMKQNNIDIYISTKGYCDMVTKILKIIDLYDYIKEIHANCRSSNCQNCTYNVGLKSDFIINKILNKYKYTVYVDDDNDNHLDIMKRIVNTPNLSKYLFIGDRIEGTQDLTTNHIDIIYKNKNKEYKDLLLVKNGLGITIDLLNLFHELSQFIYEKEIAYKPYNPFPSSNQQGGYVKKYKFRLI